MPEGIIVIGAGGFGREVADVIEAMNTPHARTWDLLGVVDDAPSAENLASLAHRQLPYLGTIDEILTAPGRPRYVIGIGSPSARRRIAARFDAAGFVAATIVHPAASQGANIKLGAGCVVCAGVRLTTNICLGSHVHLNINSTVGHDSTVGDFVSVNPLASISGDCIIQDDAVVGVCASIINGLTVGRGAAVGGGACVVRSVEDHTTVVGVPAKPLTDRRSS